MVLRELESFSGKVIVLWENGKSFDTKTFSKKILEMEEDCIFVISGAYGASEKLRAKADFCLSLSKMTFTHEMAAVLLVEQLYRVQCEEKNIPYTK